MSYEEFAADLTSHPSVRFHSAEEAEDALKRMGVSEYELRQLGRGSFRSDLAGILTSEGLALSHRFERSFSIPAHTPDGMVSLLLTSTGGGDLFAAGDVVSNNKLVVQTPETEVDLIAPDLTGAEVFGVPASRFYSLVETICPGGRSIRPGEMVAVAGDTTHLYRLRRAILDLVTHPELDPRHERQANLIAEIIAWMGDSANQWRPQGFPVNGERIRIALWARGYMEDHFSDALRMEDLCREIGVGLRRMQRAFADYFQTSPYNYLTKIRLDRARRALLSGDPEPYSVAAVAVDHGFSHLGRFSNVYRDAFGELPSETLSAVARKRRVRRELWKTKNSNRSGSDGLG